MPPPRLFLFAALGLLAATAVAAAPPKVLRYALPVAETGFDPAQVADVYSRELLDNIFDTPLRYDLLARPVALRPSTAAEMPRLSADGRELVLRLRPGLYFADDPAFHGVPRELTAADYAYSIRRHFDPQVHSAGYSDLLQDDILGLQGLREQALARHAPFDYDAPVEGLQAIDRYTLRLRFGHPRPRFAYKLASTLYAGAVAREVVEAWGGQVMEHPVGTGPYRLAQWRRSSFLVFERNPRFKPEPFDEHPAPGDADGAEIARRLRGAQEPMIDRVEVSIIEEAQPTWLAYLRGDFDLVAVPSEFVPAAVPGGRLAPSLARQHMQLRLVPRPDVVYTYFNMEDDTVGGYTPERVALRRAIGLGYDNAEDIRLLRRRLGVPAQGLVVPLMTDYDPAFRSNMSDFDPPRARALLDTYGYADRDGDGCRERPDGRPLVLHISTQTDSASRQLGELWQKRMGALGLRVVFDRGQWPEQFKQARAGRLQMWILSYSAYMPDAEDTLGIGYGPNKGEGNFSRFDLPAYDAAYEEVQRLPEGPARRAALARAQALLLAYLPVKAHVHRVRPVLSQPWLVGYPANPFIYGWWRYVDIDTARRAQSQ